MARGRESVSGVGVALAARRVGVRRPSASRGDRRARCGPSHHTIKPYMGYGPSGRGLESRSRVASARASAFAVGPVHRMLRSATCVGMYKTAWRGLQPATQTADVYQSQLGPYELLAFQAYVRKTQTHRRIIVLVSATGREASERIRRGIDSRLPAPPAHWIFDQ